MITKYFGEYGTSSSFYTDSLDFLIETMNMSTSSERFILAIVPDGDQKRIQLLRDSCLIDCIRPITHHQWTIAQNNIFTPHPDDDDAYKLAEQLFNEKMPFLISNVNIARPFFRLDVPEFVEFRKFCKEFFT